MTDNALNTLLSRIDASPELIWKMNVRAAKALLARGRILEASIIMSRRPLSCDYLPCGHVHVRRCGEDFCFLGFLSCWGAGDDGESLDGTLSVGQLGNGDQHKEGEG